MITPVAVMAKNYILRQGQAVKGSVEILAFPEYSACILFRGLLLLAGAGVEKFPPGGVPWPATAKYAFTAGK